MLTISYQKLYAALSGVDDDDGGVDHATMNAVNALPIRAIVVDSSMSENRMGGDDIVSIVDQVLNAQRDGYDIITWYGADTKVLILGVRKGDLTLTE